MSTIEIKLEETIYLRLLNRKLSWWDRVLLRWKPKVLVNQQKCFYTCLGFSVEIPESIQLQIVESILDEFVDCGFIVIKTTKQEYEKNYVHCQVVTEMIKRAVGLENIDTYAELY